MMVFVYDSVVGGKVVINYLFGKNMIGNFY